MPSDRASPDPQSSFQNVAFFISVSLCFTPALVIILGTSRARSTPARLLRRGPMLGLQPRDRADSEPARPTRRIGALRPHRRRWLATAIASTPTQPASQALNGPIP